MDRLALSILTCMLICTTDIHTQILPTVPINAREYDAYGSLLALNEHLAILAQNDKKHFTIVRNPYEAHSVWNCTLAYAMIQYSSDVYTGFVYSVSMGTKQNSSHLVFAYLEENHKREVFLTVVFLQDTPMGCVALDRKRTMNVTDLMMQERAIVGMDPYGTRAYAVGPSYMACIDLTTNTSWILDRKAIYRVEYDLIFPKAMSITEDHHIFIVGQRFINFEFIAYLIVVNFRNLSDVIKRTETTLSTFDFGSDAMDINRHATMSISLDEPSQMLVIGIPVLNTLFFLSYNHTSDPVIVRQHISNETGIAFGKSVLLIDNSTYAVLAYALPTPPWSKSQIQVYSFNGMEVSKFPLFVYPNNQQPIPAMNLKTLPYNILTIVSWKSNIGLVLDAGVALVLPQSSPGNCSSYIADPTVYMNMYTSIACIPGTARNTTSFGPCLLCPANTKSNGDGSVGCELCVNNDSVCLRGAVTEVFLENITSYDQADPYPQSPDVTAFEDILLQSIFQLMTKSSHCLVISPLFWTSLAIAVGLIILVVMITLTFFPKQRPRRELLKKVFTRVDLVGEGELWFGGLVSLAILILIGFTCNFSISFARLYPIENLTDEVRAAVSCDSSLLNAKFSSSLQLLSGTKNHEEQPMLDMLEKQNITLTIHFVSTGFRCTSVTMEQNMGREQEISSADFNCSFDNDNFILSVSTLLEQDLITVEFNLAGPYFVGGLRICLSGPSDLQDDGKYTARELDFCQFFTSFKETLTANPLVNVQITKTVNRTPSFASDDEPIFSGLWLPTLSMATRSDSVLFRQKGEYLRYLPHQLALTVQLTESDFYVKNTQEPIARQNEIIFHTILFSMLCLDIFGLIFLLLKLVIIPLVHLIQKRYFPQKNQASSNDKEQDGVAHLSQQKVQETATNSEPKPLAQTIELTTILAESGKNKSENANSRRTIIEKTYL